MYKIYYNKYKVYYENFNFSCPCRNNITFNNLKSAVEYMRELNGIEDIIIYIEY